MEISEDKKREYIRKLLIARTRILCTHDFFGLLLMNMTFRLDESIDTAATDGECIMFSPAFLDELNNSELDFVLMHEIMHIVLQHCWREKDRDHERYNIACDIVVNSNIKLENGGNPQSIFIRKYGESMHLAPNGKDGFNYTAEEVYNMLPNIKNSNTSSDGKYGKTFDNHSRWKEKGYKDGEVRDLWIKRIQDAGEAIKIKESILGRGLLPAFAKRLLGELNKPQTDWRTILANFIQEEVVDYSFTPPDRRYDGDFYLPDFNGTDIAVSNILFMIDTSGSVSDEMLTTAYSEVKGAIDQFDGKLNGYLGFFDAGIVEPQPFCDEESFRVIKPVGGGGTSFEIIFDYVREYMSDNLPTSIIILTDGYAPYPPESAAMGIPVLWVLNRDDGNSNLFADDFYPPWGKVIHIKTE